LMIDDDDVVDDDEDDDDDDEVDVDDDVDDDGDLTQSTCQTHQVLLFATCRALTTTLPN